MEMSEIKKHMNKPVMYDGSLYTLTGCMFRKNDAGFYYQAELLDKNQNSIIICKLEDVEHEQG